MHTVQFEITLPTDESAFEDMCARIYGEVFNDPTPTLNGRRGQDQAGIDLFVDSDRGRIGIQCKRYADGTLKFRHIEKEIKKADEVKAPIRKLIVATTAANDAKLVRQVQDLSDEREREGLFPVQVQFWNDICGHIRQSGKLQRDYAPNAPGAMFDQQKESSRAVLAELKRMNTEFLGVVTDLPGSRPGAVGTYLSTQLDAINERIKACRFRDALEDVNRLGANLEVFDAHQKARWYLQRGICIWQLEHGEAASADFLKAAELFPDDEKMAAAGVRGLLLRGDIQAALEAGARALETFPVSSHVWMTYANAKMINGEDLAIVDAPVAIRDNCDVLQLVAIAREQAGDLDGAVELSSQALEQPDAGFFVRRIALAFALEAATADPIRCHFGLLSVKQTEALDRAVAHFSPRQERLWPMQIPDALEDTAAHLGYAYIVLNRPEEALKLVDEAQNADKLSSSLMRVALEAYRRLDRVDKLLTKGRDWLDNLEVEGLILIAEAAAGSEDIALVDAVAASVQGLPSRAPETDNLITAIRWDALWRSRDRRAQAIDEVKAANVSASDSLTLVCGGAQILHRAGEEAERDEAVSRALELLDDTAPDSDVMHVAELLYGVGRYHDASQYYERFAVKGRSSSLHGRLLACYVKGGARRKARELLRSLPGDWASDDQLRCLALELGQLAADFQFLEPLAELQCKRSPNIAGGWLLRLSLDLKMKKMLRFHQTLELLPDELDGTPEQIAQLASLEIMYDRQRWGMKRLYRLYRRHMDDLEAATGFFIGIVTPHIGLPNMEETLPTVIEGAAVRLKDNFGSVHVVAIDPQVAAPLPTREGFYSAECPDIAWLLGARVGECIERPGPLGTSQNFEVLSITSVYRHLLQVAESKFRSSMTGAGAIASLPVVQTEHGADFSHMHAMLKRQTEHVKMVLNCYQKGPLTLGILSRLLGRNVVDIVRGWSCEDVPLFVCNGIFEARKAAFTLLEQDEATYVVDAATLAELVWLGCQTALAVLPKVYCSTQTLELLQAKLEEARAEQSCGQVFDAGDRMQYIEFTDEHRERQIAYCRDMVEAVHEYCEVVPAYGPQALPEKLHNADSVLADEEYSAILLAAEREATLMTVDGRLAHLAAVALERQTVWPQVLFYQAVQKQLITPSAYHMATVKEFVGNRTLVALGAYDLVLICMQGGAFMRQGLQYFKDFLANPATELSSAITVLFEFLKLQARQKTQLKAFLELLSHFVEAILRHPKCVAQEFLAHAERLANRMASTEAGPDFPCPILSEIRRIRYESLRKLLQDAIDSAHEQARHPVRRRAIRLKVLMGTCPPSLMFDGDVSEIVDGTMDTDTAPLTPDNQTITDEDSVTSAATAYLIDQ